MTNEKIKFQSGKSYIAKGITYLCVLVTDQEVTFQKSCIRRGKLRFRKPFTLEIIGKKAASQKAVTHTYYTDRQKYRDFIYADDICIDHPEIHNFL